MMGFRMIFAISTIIAVFIASICMLIYMLNDMGRTLWQYRYESILKKAIKDGTLQNEDIYILAERWKIERVKISETLNFVFYSIMNSPTPDQQQLTRIRTLMAWHKTQDPYADLPENITLQLQTLNKLCSNSESEIHKLAISLGEFYISKKKGAKIEKMISRVSLFIGLVGTTFTIIYPFISTK